MARRLPAPLVGHMIAAADTLARQPGSPTFRQACMRRAVSSAYYAVFHALCFICADELVGWSRTAVLPPIYRSLDHGTARKKLTGNEARGIAPEVKRIGDLFALLQEQRHAADYSPPAPLFDPKRTFALIDDARDAIALIEALGSESRLRLAVLLVARQRSVRNESSVR